MARARHARALPAGIQVAREHRARLPDHGQVHQRGGAARHEGGGRQPRPAAADRRAAGGAARDLRLPALLDDSVRRAARRGVRARHAARDPARGARRVQAPAQPVAALPPRPADGRHDARHRARHARHLDLIVIFIIFHNSGHPGVRACRCGAARQVRLALRRGDLRRSHGVHRVHRQHHRVAHGSSRRAATTRTSGNTRTRRPRTRPRSACSTSGRA